MTTGPGFKKLLHLADARKAFAAGDFEQAITEVDSAIAFDPRFVAAQSLRREILACMAPGSPAADAKITKAHPSPSAAPRTFRRIFTGVGATVVIGAVVAGLTRGSVAARPTTIAPIAPAPVADTPATKLSSISAFVARVPDALVTPEPAVLWVSPRLTQLNVRHPWRAAAIQVEDRVLLRDLGEAISELWVGTIPDRADAIFIGGPLDAEQWISLRASLKATGGVVWRIRPVRNGAIDDAGVTMADAAAAGFARLRRIRYTPDYLAEEFTPRKAVRQ
jgi:hypothetical protein